MGDAMNVEITNEYKYTEDGNNVITVPVGKADLPDRFAKKAVASGHAKATRPANNKALKPNNNKAKK